MPNPYFQFKKFTVYHDLCAMKVGIDGVLLGAWANHQSTDKNILDLGTGSGLIALMLAQRNPLASITAIDIDENACRQAEINFNASPWSDRLHVQHKDFHQFQIDPEHKFDLIVSNPPYFVNSLKAGNTSRTTARHTDHLSHENLMLKSSQMIKETGRICLILPVTEGLQCIEFAAGKKIYCYQQVFVHPKPGAEAKRLLIEFGHQEKVCTTSHLTIESDQRHQYSPEFSKLAADFYLKL